MTARYLFGPVTASFAGDNLRRPRLGGSCLAFDATGNSDFTIRPSDSWETLCARFPPDWRPDFLALWLPYTHIPAGLWSAPVPLIGLAADWNLLWHHYRGALRNCDLIFSDTAGVERLTQEGLSQARVGNLFGCEQPFLQNPASAIPRDIDILFVGNLNPAIHRERLTWLGRLVRLA